MDLVDNVMFFKLFKYININNFTLVIALIATVTEDYDVINTVTSIYCVQCSTQFHYQNILNYWVLPFSDNAILGNYPDV